MKNHLEPCGGGGGGGGEKEKEKEKGGEKNRGVKWGVGKKR